MLIGFPSSRPFWWRRRRRTTGARGLRPAAAASELGAWRGPPPAKAAARRGNARPAVARAALEAPAGAPPAAPAAAEIVLEPARPKVADGNLGHAPGQLLERLRPACQALAAAAFAAAGAGPRERLILVTSPAAGAAQSLTALELALGLCRSGRPVLLVDADGHSAGAARRLGWPPQPGLWDALAGAVALEGLIGHSGLDDLWFLPPGRPRAATPALLASRRLPELMRALLARAPSGLVVIDGPPLLAGIAAPALAACAGQVVLMIAAGRTSQQAIDDSLKRLGARRHLYAVFGEQNLWPRDARATGPAGRAQPGRARG